MAPSRYKMRPADERKALGQYFSGPDLGRLLATISRAGEANSIIDPMAGIGDLLSGCIASGARPSLIAGVDIDPHAVDELKVRLPRALGLAGSAFDPAILSRLPTLSWDLVIANPPYVRYQRSVGRGNGDIAAATHAETRARLATLLELLPALDREDRRLFKALALGYSGLADLAVPCWLLCAGLVKMNGRLAIIVPQSWLSRDYSSAVQYLLSRWFEVEVVVDDLSGSWFSDAQVKTSMVVARRVERKHSAFHTSKKLLRVGITSSHTDGGIASEVLRALDTGDDIAGDGYSSHMVSQHRLFPSLPSSFKKQKKWSDLMGDVRPSSSAMPTIIPHELHQWLGIDGLNSSLIRFEHLAPSVGQGLRTGANSFFYCTSSVSNGEAILTFDKPISMVIRDCDVGTRTVLRNQKELPVGFKLSRSLLTGRVLDLNGFALQEDIQRDRAIQYHPLPLPLADLVTKATKIDYVTSSGVSKLYDLSAVSPNIRKGQPAKDLPPRYWYMLPKFAMRHTPELLIARLNADGAKAFLNDDIPVVVDANFITVNCTSGSEWDRFSLLALMNCTWCSAWLELTASTMGGGALKIDAPHVRNILVPNASKENVKKLRDLGLMLSTVNTGSSDEIIDDIDAIIVSELKGRPATIEDVTSLRLIVSKHITLRKTKAKLR